MSRTIVLINSLGGGGAERQVSYLDEAGLVEKIFTLTEESSFPQIKSKSLFNGNKFRHLEIIKHMILGPLFLSRVITKSDRLLSFLEISNFINLLCKKFFTNHKAIISVRISPSFYKKYKLGIFYKILIAYLYPNADLIIVNSKDNAEELVNEYELERSKILVIPNAVDKELILLKSKEKVPAINNFLVCVGRLDKQKNLKAALSIFKKVSARHPQLKLLLLGRGPLEQELIRYCKELGLTVGKEEGGDTSIVLLGFMPNPFSYIKHAKLLLLPSLYEGLPNVLLESMTLSTPVIAADCPTGPREILEGGGGVLLGIPTSESDYKIWCSRIDELLSNDAQLNELKLNAEKNSINYEKTKILSLWSKVLN